MRVRDVMSAEVHTVSVDSTAAAAWEAMKLHRVRHLVVMGDDGRMAGVLSATDLGGRRGERLRANKQVADVMTEKVIVAAPGTTVREAANLMRGNVVNCLPVLEGHKLKGIVTALDLLELIGRGAERPVDKGVRAILKDRGVRPRAQTAAKATHRTRAAVR